MKHVCDISVLKGSSLYTSCAVRVLEDHYTPQEVADLLSGKSVKIVNEDSEEEFEFIEGEVLTF